ncbi:MAG: hypothetical protein J0H29_09945 [Sphingobacteriales bacterium]|nr:hypothetical protein [Sphingobacteriales bacterium]
MLSFPKEVFKNMTYTLIIAIFLCCLKRKDIIVWSMSEQKKYLLFPGGNMLLQWIDL